MPHASAACVHRRWQPLDGTMALPYLCTRNSFSPPNLHSVNHILAGRTYKWAHVGTRGHMWVHMGICGSTLAEMCTCHAQFTIVRSPARSPMVPASAHS